MIRYNIREKLHRMVALVLAVSVLASNMVQFSYASSDSGELVCGKSEHSHTQAACYKEVSVLTCGLEEGSVHTHAVDCYEEIRVQSCTEPEQEAHDHEAACYTEKQVLNCGTEASDAHAHEDACYTAQTVLSCGKPVTAGHTHAESCYEVQQKLVCQLEENVPHVHAESCYTASNSLTCMLAEHTHDTACYAPAASDPAQADCTCGAGADSDLHEDGCPLYEEPVCECGSDTDEHEATCFLYKNSILATGEGPVLSAMLYKDAACTYLDTSLLGTTNAINGWQYDTNRYLEIDLSELRATTETPYQLVIEMQPALYLNLTADPTLQNAQVSFEQNDPIDANKTGSYTPKKYSVKTLTYLLSEDIGSCSFTLPICYDNVLWNHLANAVLGDGSGPLLEIRLQQQSGDSFVDVDGCTAALHQATSGSAMTRNQQLQLYNAQNKDGKGSSISINSSESTYLSFEQMVNTIYYEGYFYKPGDLKIELTVPSAMIEGKTYKMDYTERFYPANGEADYTETLVDDVVTFDFGPTYVQSNTVTRIDFAFKAENQEALKALTEQVSFRGTFKVTAYGQTLGALNFEIKLENVEEPLFTHRHITGDTNIYDLDTVQYLGLYGVANSGGDSGPVTVQLNFDPENTHAFGVTTILVMAPGPVTEIPVRYTLTNRDGTSTVTGTFTLTKASATSSSSIKVTRKNLPAEYRSDYYYKSVEYDLKTVPRNSVMYSNSATKAHSCAGTFWGYIFEGTARNCKVVTANLLDRDTRTPFAGMGRDVYVSIKDSKKVAYGIEDGVTLSKTAIKAGESVTLKGRVYTVSYPYTANNCLSDILLGLKLPEGMTVVKESISATFKNGSKLAVAELIPPTDSNPLWRIIFEPGEKIGYANENLDPIPNGDVLNFSIQLNSSTLMPRDTWDVKKSLFVAGQGRENGASGTYVNFSVVDTYDLNGNGSTTDKIGCSTTELKLSIEPADAVLDIDANLHKEGEGSGSTMTIDGFGEENKVWYNVNIRCTRGGSADDFLYLIPIVNENSSEEDNFIEVREAGLQLLEKATVANTAGTDMMVLYSTEKFDSYRDAKLSSSSLWKTKDQISDADLPKVTYLKVVVAPQMMRSSNTVIVNGTDVTVSLPLVFGGLPQDFPSYAGTKIIWRSRGYYDYTLGVQMASDNSSPEVTLILQYEEKDPRNVVLVAGDTENDKKTLNDLPVMKLPQSYTIIDISPKNLTLGNESTDFSAMDSTEANNTFAVSVDFGNGSEQYLAKGETLVLGSMAADTAPQLTFKVYSASVLTEAVEEKYVDFTLFGDNGVLIPIRVKIDRQLTRAEVSAPAITAGKSYTTFHADDTVTISQDAAFTAQYVAKLVPDLYSDRTLSFGTRPKSGTTITMLDLSEASAPGYYYYNIANADDENILLTEFVRMGTTAPAAAGDYYQEPEGSASVDEVLLFVVQLPESGESIQSNTISLTRTFGTDKEVQALTFITAAKRTFKLEMSKPSEVIGSAFEISYATTASDGAESRYTGTRTLVLHADGSDPLPAEARVVANGRTYWQNADGNIIIPFDNTQKITLQLLTETASTCSLKAELWVSATGEDSKPFMGKQFDAIGSIEFEVGQAPSFKVRGMNSRLIYRENLSQVEVSILSNHLNNLTLEVQKKEGQGYVTQTDVLNAVDGLTQHSSGVFTIANKRRGTLALAFYEKMEPGTYRLLFKTTVNGKTVEIPYGFIVQ